MTIRQNRREFLKGAIACAGAAAAVRMFGAPNILPAGSLNNHVLRTTVIGCGKQGSRNHIRPAARQRLVALVDADEMKLGESVKIAQGVDAGAKIKTYTDYRKLFDEMHKEIDAVFIATPNHQHALPALIAMQLGKGVYVEKPLAHDIHEVQLMAQCAAKYKVATQMGNQGHSGEAYRRLCEYIWAGAIGDVTEVHCWTNRANGGAGGRPASQPCPSNLHWEQWIGPAPYREFHEGLHPHGWHGWHDFGNGSLGNMGCHVMDGAFWALKLEHPTAIEVEEMAGGSVERYPTGTRIRWDYPARGNMPAVKIYWYDGQRKDIANPGKGSSEDSVDAKSQNRPPLASRIEKKYNRHLEFNGSLYVGTKGIMYTGTYGDGVRIIPEAQHQATPKPPKTIPRITGSHQDDFFRACKGGPPSCANFEYSAQLTQMVLLGCLAIKAGVGRKVEWDGPNTQCTNIPEVNQYIRRDYRKGWQI